MPGYWHKKEGLLPNFEDCVKSGSFSLLSKIRPFSAILPFQTELGFDSGRLA